MSIDRNGCDPWESQEKQRKWDLKIAMGVFMVILVISSIIYGIKDVLRRKGSA